MKFKKDYSEISKKSFIDEIEYAKNILADVTFDFRTNEIITKKS